MPKASALPLGIEEVKVDLTLLSTGFTPVLNVDSSLIYCNTTYVVLKYMYLKEILDSNSCLSECKDPLHSNSLNLKGEGRGAKNLNSFGGKLPHLVDSKQ